MLIIFKIILTLKELTIEKVNELIALKTAELTTELEKKYQNDLKNALQENDAKLQISNNRILELEKKRGL